MVGNSPTSIRISWHVPRGANAGVMLSVTSPFKIEARTLAGCGGRVYLTAQALGRQPRWRPLAKARMTVIELPGRTRHNWRSWDARLEISRIGADIEHIYLVRYRVANGPPGGCCRQTARSAVAGDWCAAGWGQNAAYLSWLPASGVIDHWNTHADWTLGPGVPSEIPRHLQTLSRRDYPR